MAWLEGERSEAATERILNAVGELFAEAGDAGVSMDAIAKAAGCSRATLYRYFDNRHAVVAAFAHREAGRIVAQVATEVGHLRDPAERAQESVLACLRMVRADERLRAWYDDGRTLREVLRESPLIESWASGTAGDEPDVLLGRWVLRAIMSFLAVPGDDEEEERAMVTRFLAPHLV